MYITGETVTRRIAEIAKEADARSGHAVSFEEYLAIPYVGQIILRFNLNREAFTLDDLDRYEQMLAEIAGDDDRPRLFHAPKPDLRLSPGNRCTIFFTIFSRSVRQTGENHGGARGVKRNGFEVKNGALSAIRTRDLLLRREPLYPSEL